MESTTVKDPVCGKEVDTLRARAVGIFGGVTYYFCSAECKSKFKDPRKVPREPTANGKLAQAERAERAERTRDREPDEPLPEAEPLEASDDIDEIPKSRSGLGAWLVVAMLFAAAGAVLIFAFK
jgi:YHS domain-containing protein